MVNLTLYMQPPISDKEGKKIYLSLDPDFGNDTIKTIPEVEMWCSLMTDALEEIGIRDDPDNFQRVISFRIWRDTRRWVITVDSKNKYIGSFDWVCQTINQSPKELRKLIFNYRCVCCNHRVIVEPCMSVVKRLPSYAHKVCVEPELIYLK